jgi:two-component system, cell cycle response regulator DivK
MKKLLVVEDNDFNRDLAVQILEDDYEVLEAEDAQKGLAICRSDQPDLVLTDISLPGMDGLEMVAILRQSLDICHIPVIAVTAHAMAGDRERTLDAGCDGYISKPIDEDELLKMIGELISKSRN